MRHGRKSKSVRFCGYKRHILRDLDTELVRAVGVTLANAPEASVTGAIAEDLEHQEGAELSELHVDRAYLSSELVRDRPPELEVYCKAWRVSNGERFPKTAFEMDWERGSLRCPAGIEMPFEPGGWCVSPRRRAPSAPCGSAAPRARGAAGAFPSTPTSGCWRSSGSASARRRGGRS